MARSHLISSAFPVWELPWNFRGHPALWMELDTEPTPPSQKYWGWEGLLLGSCSQPTKTCGTDIFRGPVPASVSVARPLPRNQIMACVSLLGSYKISWRMPYCVPEAPRIDPDTDAWVMGRTSSSQRIPSAVSCGSWSPSWNTWHV